MGLFTAKPKINIENARCSKCHKRITRQKDLNVIKGDIYCTSCLKRKMDKEALFMAVMLDDD